MNRDSRTARIQLVSRPDDMEKIKAEIESVYSYDAWSALLAEEAPPQHSTRQASASKAGG
jgi:hypothetical protein